MQVADKLVNIISSTINRVDQPVIEKLLNIVSCNKPIFITGAGRSKLVGQFLAMRLMHLGKKVYIVGGLCTPSIQKGDFLIAISGSGQTLSAVSICKEAKKIGAYIISITSKKHCKIVELSDLVIPILIRERDDYSCYAPMGTVFETSTLIFLESFIGTYMLNQNITENQLKRRHANLE